MDTSARGRRRKRGVAGSPGTFRPGIPGDTHEVMQLFAVAARAVCVSPDRLDEASLRLSAVAARLVPPEATAAAECMRLWHLFARVAQVPKESLRIEAGRALCRDLDTLGQRLDLPPLADWEQLPSAVDDPSAVELAAGTSTGELITLLAAREHARDVMTRRAGAPFPAAEAARLVSGLGSVERRQLFEQMVGLGLLGRSDVNLLIRFLIKGDDVGTTDTTLIEVLDRLGRYLAQ